VSVQRAATVAYALLHHRPMPITALVLSLDEDAARRAVAVEWLATDPRLTLGPLAGPKLPVVAETRDLMESEQLVEQLLEAPGVSFVDLVMVDFSEEESAEGWEGR
jgi:hypothetical protein